MKSFSSRYTATGAVAVLCVAVTTMQQGTFAFAPAMVKGREMNLHSSIVAPELPTEIRVKTTTTKSTKNNKRKPTKKKASTKSTKKNQRKPMKTKGTEQRKKQFVKNAPKRKNTAKDKKSINIKSFKPLKDLELGSKISGKVVDVCDFGAFINIGYATRGSRAGTALLHISQLSGNKIENIRDVLKVGDDVEGARVVNVDLKKGEVGLSLRAPRPKRRDFRDIKVGNLVEGRVDSVVSYGVFIDVGANVNGA